jgi:hypothetical protein
MSSLVAPRQSNVTAKWSCNPRAGPGPYGFRNWRPCSARISFAMLVGDSRRSSANGAFGRHKRHESDWSPRHVAVAVERAKVDRLRGATDRNR